MKIKLEDIKAVNQTINCITENGRLDIRRVLYERRCIQVFMPSSLGDAPTHLPGGNEFHAVEQVKDAMITLDDCGNVVVDFPESSFKKE